MKLTDFLTPFKAAGIYYINHLVRNGLLVFEKSGWPLHVDTFTFYNYHGMRMRPGWAAWLLFVNYRLHHTFPSSLVESYMPKMSFGFFNISVPRGGVEILKYLYRSNWWKEVKPIGCWLVKGSFYDSYKQPTALNEVQVLQKGIWHLAPLVKGCWSNLAGREKEFFLAPRIY